jgi:hypothetical protein
MGERSQIYIKWNVHANKENMVGAIARYFQWNYGERMISRARGIIETLEEYMKYKYMFSDKWYIEKLTRIAETNFDMRDIVWSSNIIDEYNEYGNEDNFADIVFYGQDNNDGQLFIDITDSGIKYALALEYGENGYKPISAEQYMKENMGDYSESGDWRVDAKERGYLDYTEDNIKYINENAELMTAEEIAQFIEGVRDIYEQPF